jgi:hypothetical protein
MSKRFTAQIFRWLDQVNADAELPATALKVCVELAGCFREAKNGGMAWPGLQTIADTIGKSKATVLNAIRMLEQRGHLKVQYGHPGAGHSNHYWMLEKGQPANLSAQPKKVRKKGQPANLNLLTPPSEEEPKGSSSSGGERERPSAFVSPPPGAGAFAGPAPEEEQEGVPSSAEIRLPPRCKADGLKESFNPLRRVWARPWADADDDVAFRLYCAAHAEVGHAVIFEAALAWVAAADAPRFLPSLAKWLQARGWEKSPPQKAPAKKTPSRSPSPQRQKHGAAYAIFLAGQEG